MTVTGGSKRAGLPGNALAIEDVPGRIDDQDIVGAVAVDVGHQRRGVRGVANLPGSEKVPSPLPSSTDTVVGAVVGDGQVGAAVAGEVARHDGVWTGPHRVGDLGLEGAVAVAQQHRHVVVEPSLATARSGRPSPLKSPATMRVDSIPTA